MSIDRLLPMLADRRSFAWRAAVSQKTSIWLQHHSRLFTLELGRVSLLAGSLIIGATGFHQSWAAETELGSPLLSSDQLVSLVLERNPSLSSAKAAADAASFRIVPAGALDDPNISYRIAPNSIGKGGMHTGQMVEVSQPLPWFGTLAARENVARSNAHAEENSAEATRLSIIESTKSAFSEWYFIHEAIRLNAEQQVLVKDLIAVAEAKLASGDGLQQDVLRAETELALLEDQGLSLSAARTAIASRINALANTDVHADIPPPAPLTIPASLPDAESVLSAAISRHPEIARAEAMVSASRSGVRLAEKGFYPNFSVSTGYNSMMPMERMRWNVGISLNIPLNRGLRKANLSAARADERARELDLIDRRANLQADVTSAYANVMQAMKSTALLENRLVPLARETLDVSISEYRSGAGDFLSVITAERSELSAEQSLYRARTDLYRQLAALERAAGGPFDDLPVSQAGTSMGTSSIDSEGTQP